MKHPHLLSTNSKIVMKLKPCLNRIIKFSIQVRVAEKQRSDVIRPRTSFSARFRQHSAVSLHKKHSYFNTRNLVIVLMSKAWVIRLF